MESKKIILLGIIIFLLGIIVLPETFALFQNQHSFYNMTEDQGVPCVKCHSDVATQLMNSPDSPHSEFKCGDCHKINMIELGTHAATVPLCIDCHNGNMTPNSKIDPHKMGNSTNCVKCHDGPMMATGLNVSGEIYNANEPHRTFIVGSNNDTLLKGSNEACIGCHTKTTVNITWHKPTTMSFTVNYTNTWTVGSFSESGESVVNTTG